MRQALCLPAAILGLALLHAAPGVRAQITVDHSKVINGTVAPGIPAEYPLRLNKPGHYILTSDLWAPAGKVGIQVSADNVTIDLNGFTLTSGVQCARFHPQPQLVTCFDKNWQPVVENHFHGIATNRIDTVVRNGRVKGFSGHGIWASGAITLENVIVGSNAGSGVVLGHVQTRSSRLSGVVAESNAGDGARVQNALVERSVFSSNGRHGLQAARTAVLHSTVRGNLGLGLDALFPSTLLGLTMFDNAGGAMAGPVVSLGSNFDGTAPF